MVSDLGGIDCGSSCEADFSPVRSYLTLRAIPDPGFGFHGWGGGCPATGCRKYTVSLSQSTSITATFGPPGVSLTISGSRAGNPGSTVGSGTVKSSPPGIDCTSGGQDSTTKCSFAAFAPGTSVTLTATPARGSSFRNWNATGEPETCRSKNPCVLKMNEDLKSVTADFDRSGSLFEVRKSGSGSGNVKSTPFGWIDCGTNCYINHSGGSISVVATPDPGSIFTGWTGCDSVTGNTCTVMVGADDRAVTADFVRGGVLQVIKYGFGTVTSAPAGIDCGSACSMTFMPNTPVTLTATPLPGSVLAYWSGGCSGASSTCNVVMSGDMSVSAVFAAINAKEYRLTVAKRNTSNGNGTVTSADGFINCAQKAGTCSKAYYPNTPVTLTATPSADSTFTGWSGACTASSGACSITMEKARSVTAHFVGPQTLTVSRSNPDKGDGTVTSSPPGIDCLPTCKATFPLNTPVSLTATAATNSIFTGWSGGCTGPDTCNVTMEKARSVTAHFTGPQKLKVSKQSVRKGTGTVTSSSGGIICDTGCSSSSEFIPLHGTVTLTATPDQGSAVTGWKPKALNCSGTACTVTMDRDLTVTVTFAAEAARGQEFGDDDEEE